MTTQSPSIPYLQSPATICNQAIDKLGEPGQIIGDITDGTAVAEAARRNYGQGLRQLLRTAHWNFARKRAKLQLLGDATGSASTDVPPVSSDVEQPWAYAYAWPTDAVQGRWLPWTPINAQPENSSGVPLTTGNSAIAQYNFVPGCFLISSSDKYPIVEGQIGWDQLPDLQRTEGLGLTSRKVILTNCCEAHFVYTRLVTQIEEWDDLFREAFVTMMAIVLAPTVLKADPKRAMAERDRLIAVLKMAVADARVANGNESGWPQTTDFESSYVRARNWGAGWGGYGSGYGGFGSFAAGPGGMGYFGCGFDSLNWCGSVF